MHFNRQRLQHILKVLGLYPNPRDWWLLIGALRARHGADLPPDIWRTINAIDGFLAPAEAALIHWAARNWPSAGPVLDLGSFFGRSVIAFALGGRFVYAIDAWHESFETLDQHSFSKRMIGEDVYQAFLKNTRQTGFADQIAVRRGLTAEIGQSWTEPCALLYVDAGRAYTEARTDLEIWAPHLKPDGLLLIHDVIGAFCPGVIRAASDVLKPQWRIVARANSLLAFVRR